MSRSNPKVSIKFPTHSEVQMFKTIFKKQDFKPIILNLYSTNGKRHLYASRINSLNCLFNKMQSFAIKMSKVTYNTAENP